MRGNLHDTPLRIPACSLGNGLRQRDRHDRAAMVFIRPLLRANDDRKHNGTCRLSSSSSLSPTYGGSLTPLGDPPLFLGFLRGVDFFWTTKFLWKETLFAVIVLRWFFYALDSWMQRYEGDKVRDPTPDSPLRVTGLVNLALIAVIIAAHSHERFMEAGHFLDRIRHEARTAESSAQLTKIDETIV